MCVMIVHTPLATYCTLPYCWPHPHCLCTYLRSPPPQYPRGTAGHALSAHLLLSRPDFQLLQMEHGPEGKVPEFKYKKWEHKSHPSSHPHILPALPSFPHILPSLTSSPPSFSHTHTHIHLAVDICYSFILHWKVVDLHSIAAQFSHDLQEESQHNNNMAHTHYLHRMHTHTHTHTYTHTHTLTAYNKHLQVAPNQGLFP